jgi:hypothetical protein
MYINLERHRERVSKKPDTWNSPRTGKGNTEKTALGNREKI